MLRTPSPYELYCVGRLAETLQPLPDETAEQLRGRALARADAIGALAYVRHHAHLLDSAHWEFPCREVGEDRVAVATPVGTFVLRARRARPGELYTSYTPGGTEGMSRATHQVPPPVAATGRLLPPEWPCHCWRWQPECFTYEDGTASSFLGAYPVDVEWEGETPEWDADAWVHRYPRGWR
jgi:hypothetical protein